MKKIISKVDPKTGIVEVKTEGFSGDECYKETEPLERRLGLNRACAVNTPEFYQEKQDTQQEVGGA